MSSQYRNQIIVVEAYEGVTEFLSDEPDEIKAARAIGLPLEEITARLDCTAIVLGWDDWWKYEAGGLRVSVPATQPVNPPQFDHLDVQFESERIQRVIIPATDPIYELPFEVAGLSPRSYGLINDSGLNFFASYCLNKVLQMLHQKDPFQAVILPMWSGIGYVAQMARATKAPQAVDVPFGVVVTDTSLTRQTANQEGCWTRHAIIRRQMEDVSLALADLALTFGERGKTVALAGRLPEANLPIMVPRRIEPSVLEAIATAATPSSELPELIEFFLYEPQQAASGVLATLDAVQQLSQQGIQLEQPVISAGPPMVFAPMKPREFTDYWSSRGYVRELLRDRQWTWQRDYPATGKLFRVRLYPSSFEYLPNIWTELARGSLVLLSAAAVEGLAPGQTLPSEILIPCNADSEGLSKCLASLAGTDIQKLEQLRQQLCTQVVTAHQSQERQHLLETTIAALQTVLQAPPTPQDLSRVALLFGDRTKSLHTLAQTETPPVGSPLSTDIKPGTLSVVITCYEVGALLEEAVESLWNSSYLPDEILIVDDGSQSAETLTTIEKLKQNAADRTLPLRVIHKRNEGLAAARNTGLAAATGEFISFLDGDDLIEPLFYQLALQLLQQYPQLGGVAAWASIFGNDVPDGFWNAPQAELPLLLVENSVIVPCVTRTALLRQLGGYDSRQRYNYEDWELSIRMVASGHPIVTIPMNLLRYRIRGDSLYRSMTDVQNQVMRELLLTNHREVVAKFAVELAMQAEHQWKQLAYSSSSSAPEVTTNQHSVPLPGAKHPLVSATYKVLASLLPKLQFTH